MDHDAIEDLVRRMVAGWNAGDPEAVGRCYARDAVSYDIEFGDEPQRGREAIAAGVAMYLRAFPGAVINVQNIFGDGRMVCEEWTSEGEHHGAFLGIPPTGKLVLSRGCNVMRVNDEGLIEHERVYWDSVQTFRQLNVDPSSVTAPL
jgi:steroid delta-isomerase-like uncharacterized protein